MMPKNDRSLQAKETALLALAQGDPDFPAFLDRYRQALPQVAELPAELVEELMAAVEEDPALGELAKAIVALEASPMPAELPEPFVRFYSLMGSRK